MAEDTREWVVLALDIIRKEAGDAIFTEYEDVFKEITSNQADLREQIKDAQEKGDKVREEGLRLAYDSTLISVKNTIRQRKMDVQDKAVDGLSQILRIVFRILLKVVVA